MASRRLLGVVLSGATTRRAQAQLTAEGESVVREGMLVGVELGDGIALARVEGIRAESDVQKPGGLWSLVRREEPQALEALSTSYVIAELYLLGRAGVRGLPPLDRPPRPGARVYELPSDPAVLFGVGYGEPGIVWYGSMVGYSGLPVPLDVEAVTMHVGVFGETGSGKSYGVGYLLELLASIPLGDGEKGALPAIIIDANGDYLDYHDAFVKTGLAVGEWRSVKRYVSPRSSAKSLPYTEQLVISLDSFSPREVAEMIIAYKTGGRDLNEMQVSALDRVLSELVEEGYSLTELLTDRVDALYAKLEELSRGREAVIHHQTARAIRSAVEKFHREVYREHHVLGRDATLTRELIDTLTEEPGLVIVDFSADGSPGVPLQLKQLIVAYIARLLYERFTWYKVHGEDRYLVFVIEEAQNYAPNTRNYPIGISIARDYLALIATQGRKFGISLLLVTQRPAFLDPVILSMTNTWFIHRVAPDDVEYIRRAVGGLPPSLEKRLTSLPRGVAVVAGQMNILGHPVLVNVGKRSVPHRMGLTRIVESLRRARRAGKESRRADS